MGAQTVIYKSKEEKGISVSLTHHMTLNQMAVMIVRSEQYGLEDDVKKYHRMSLAKFKKITVAAILSFGIDNPPYYISDNNLEEYVNVIENRLIALTEKEVKSER